MQGPDKIGPDLIRGENRFFHTIMRRKDSLQE